MKIIIEEYQYDYDDQIAEVLKGLTELHDAEKKVSVSYVGYYFNPELHDCVFILPKVLLEKDEADGREKVFGHIEPRDLIDADRCTELTDTERKFIYNLSVWVYRAISVFKEHEYDRVDKRQKGPSIVLHRQAPMMGHSKRRKSNTFLDVLLALQQWNKDNQQFVMFTLKNLHAGFNKINWTRTISHSQAIIQDGSPVYLNPVNKKRQVNFDEELLIIFYSILQHISEAYGFPVVINVNFPLIRGKKFERYLDGYGRTRLKQIKYKYFSDKSLELWNLCYAFFERPYRIDINVDQKEYLLVKSFHVVFEAIIDELIAGDQHLPKDLLDQEDGKRVDHMYKYQQLVNDDSPKEIYYIGDSKYYKRGNTLASESIYKQFTYARNVVQWNLNLFNDGTPEDQEGHDPLRDDVTEGYNIIPNFFISAQQQTLEQSDEIVPADDKKQFHFSRQFENRLFDRDTFILTHYNVNFLFVLALYGRNNSAAKAAWREKARGIFRTAVQGILKEKFLFYAMTAHADVEPNAYVRQNFQMLLGKVFQPFGNRDTQQYFSLALRNPDKIEDTKLKAEISEENDTVLFQLKQSFYVEPCALGQDPRTLLPEVEPRPRVQIPAQRLTFHYIENYPDDIFLVGSYREDQREWIFGTNRKMVDRMYNVRLGVNVRGGINNRDDKRNAKFVLLYEFGKEREGNYRVFRVKGYQMKSGEELEALGYPHPQHDRYFCYVFDEEVAFDRFDIGKIISEDRISFRPPTLYSEYPEGRPIFLTGAEMMKHLKVKEEQ